MTLQEEREAIAERIVMRMDGRTVTSHAHYREMLKEELVRELLSHEEKVVARVRERIKEWAKSNARTKDTMMSDFEENHEWTIDYHELVDALTSPITDENV